MKKLLALMLSLLLVLTPLACMADGTAGIVSYGFQAEANGVSGWLQCVGMTPDAADEVGAAAADLMNSLKLDVITDEDQSAVQLRLLLGDYECLSMTYQMVDDSELIYTFSFLPDYALRVEAADTDLMAASMMDLVRYFNQDMSAWMEKIDYTEEYGTFIADAYTCTHRVVLQLEDRDLAELLKTMLDDVVDVFGGSYVTDLLSYYIDQMSEKNLGRMQLVVGMDEVEFAPGYSYAVPVGFSLTLGTEQDTLFTMSLGIGAPANMVCAFTANDTNWFVDLTCSMDMDTMVVQFNGHVRKANGNTGYRAALENGQLMLSVDTALQIGQSDKYGMVEDTSITLPNGNIIGQKSTCALDASEWLTTITYGEDAATAWKAMVTSGVTEPLALPDLSSRTILSAETPSFAADVQEGLLAVFWDTLAHLPESVLDVLLGF